MKAKTMLLILVFMSLGIGLTQATPAEVIKNNLTNTDWINQTSNVIHNLTLGEIRLNGTDTDYWNLSSGWGESPSDTARFTTSQGGERLNWDIRISGEERFYQYNEGAWDDFSIYFEFYCDVIQTYVDVYRANFLWSCSTNKDWTDQRVGNDEGFGISFSHINGATFYLYPRELTNGNSYANNTGGVLSVDTQYYINLRRDGVDTIMYVYSDASYSTPVSGWEGGITLTLHSDWGHLDYMMLGQSLDRSGAYDIQGYIDHITYALGGYSDGYIETPDLLANYTGQAYQLNLNATIPNYQSLNVSISDDGLTWRNSTIFDDPENMTVIGKYLEHLNLTSLYVRIDMITDGSQSPVLYDLHLTYLTDVGNGGENGLTFGDLTWLIAFIWWFVLGLGYAKELFELKIFGSIAGIIFGLTLLDDSQLIALLVVFLNIVILVWEAQAKEKKR